MSDEVPETGSAAVPDPEVVALAGKIFDLARAGDTDALAAYVDAGVSADLTNDSGDSLVMLAAYHGHAASVRSAEERERILVIKEEERHHRELVLSLQIFEAHMPSVERR